MLKRLLITGGLIAIAVARYNWTEHSRSERARQTFFDQNLPALSNLSADRLVDADWSYSGPLGKLTLRFERDGKLVVTSDASNPSGRWEIIDMMLYAHIPGADNPHHGIFRKSTDELSGASPTGLQPRTWTATRDRELK